MHRTLSPLLGLTQLLGQRIAFVSTHARNRFGWIPFRFPRQVISQQGKHFGMAINAWRDRKKDLYLLFEHKADYSWPLYFVLFLSRRPVFFFVHDMQQVATITVRCKLALNLCRWWVRTGEFYPLFISLSDLGLPDSYRFDPDKSLTIPHPHHLAENPPAPRPLRKPGQRFRVGIIGTARKEKPIQKLIEVLARARTELDFDLVVGTPRALKPAWLDTIGVEVMDTTTEAQYSACLSSLDIFVVDFVQEEYYFRPSGAVMDAGMNGCFVLCPDFPVFREQIAQPVPIGTTFRSIDEIPAVLRRVMPQLEAAPIDSAAWRRHHRVENIARMMQAFLDRRAATKAAAGTAAISPRSATGGMPARTKFPTN